MAIFAQRAIGMRQALPFARANYSIANRTVEYGMMMKYKMTEYRGGVRDIVNPMGLYDC